MEINLCTKNLTKKDEKFFSEYLEQKRPAIEQLLTKFAKDAKILNVTIEKFEKHDAYEVEFNLKLPAKSLHAKEASHQITKAVDLSKDRLIAQLKKHLDQLRKNRSHKSIRDHEIHKVEKYSPFEA